MIAAYHIPPDGFEWVVAIRLIGSRQWLKNDGSGADILDESCYFPLIHQQFPWRGIRLAQLPLENIPTQNIAVSIHRKNPEGISNAYQGFDLYKLSEVNRRSIIGRVSIKKIILHRK